MSEPPSERSTASGQNPVTNFLWGAPLVLALYVLSIGPVVKLTRPGLPPSPVIIFYAPLEALAAKSETARRFFHWYIEDVWKAK
jgi:hypothetical protein